MNKTRSPSHNRQFHSRRHLYVWTTLNLSRKTPPTTTTRSIPEANLRETPLTLANTHPNGQQKGPYLGQSSLLMPNGQISGLFSGRFARCGRLPYTDWPFWCTEPCPRHHHIPKTGHLVEPPTEITTMSGFSQKISRQSVRNQQAQSERSSP